jgi:hypothetical protein
MSITNSQHTKSAWSSIFKRKGASGKHTKLFEDFDVVGQKAIVEHASLGEDELPVLASTPTEGSWFLLTTKRLLLFAGEANEAVEASSIAEVLPAEFGHVRKEEMTLLKLKLNGGRELRVQVEAGLPFFGVWNVLRNAVARNKSAD